MPQNADKLPDAEIDLIRRWINGGALENAGSKAAKPKPKMIVAAETAPGKRPEVIPLPPRMVLEPAFRMAHAPMARSLATSPWAPLVAVTSQRQVLLYNTTTLELVGVFPFPEGQPNVVRFSRDGRLLLAGGGRPAASGKVVVWDITTGERVFEVGNELDVVLAADISADHKRIALGGPQRRRASLFDRNGRAAIRNRQAHRLGAVRRVQPRRRPAGDRRPQRRVVRVGSGDRPRIPDAHRPHGGRQRRVVARRFERAGLRFGRRDRCGCGKWKTARR